MKTSLYGKYAGKLKSDASYVENCSEMELFIQVSAYYEPIRNHKELLSRLAYYEKMKLFYLMNEDESALSYFEDLIKDTTKLLSFSTILLENRNEEHEYAMDFCILQTKKFGTQVSYNPAGRVTLTEEFNEWYKNWQLYVNNMDKTTLDIYRTYRYEGKSLDNFRNVALQQVENTYEINNDIDGYQPAKTKKNIKRITA